VIVKVGMTVNVKVFDAVCDGVPLSVTWTVKLDGVVVDGVPLSTPADDKFIPVGNDEPDASAQV
jgi:hypothetical protein